MCWLLDHFNHSSWIHLSNFTYWPVLTEDHLLWVSGTPSKEVDGPSTVPYESVLSYWQERELKSLKCEFVRDCSYKLKRDFPKCFADSNRSAHCSSLNNLCGAYRVKRYWQSVSKTAHVDMFVHTAPQIGSCYHQLNLSMSIAQYWASNV